MIKVVSADKESKAFKFQKIVLTIELEVFILISPVDVGLSSIA